LKNFNGQQARAGDSFPAISFLAFRLRFRHSLDRKRQSLVIGITCRLSLARSRNPIDSMKPFPIVIAFMSVIFGGCSHMSGDGSPLKSAEVPAETIWQFKIRSYWVDAGFSETLPESQPSLTAIALSSEVGGPTAGQPNAVAYFYWPGRPLPKTPTKVHNHTLELHYPLSAFGGIQEMLESGGDLHCYYSSNPKDPLGPRSGIRQGRFRNR
jgi:hypothetical protein